MMHSDGCLLGAEETYEIPLPTVICANEPDRAPSSQTLTGTRKRRFFFKTRRPQAFLSPRRPAVVDHSSVSPLPHTTSFPH